MLRFCLFDLGFRSFWTVLYTHMEEGIPEICINLCQEVEAAKKWELQQQAARVWSLWVATIAQTSLLQCLFVSQFVFLFDLGLRSLWSVMHTHREVGIPEICINLSQVVKAAKKWGQQQRAARVWSSWVATLAQTPLFVCLFFVSSRVQVLIDCLAYPHGGRYT